MTAHTLQLVAQLKAAFGSIERITLESADKLNAILEQAPREALEILFRERVKFCWSKAHLILRNKYGVTL